MPSKRANTRYRACWKGISGPDSPFGRHSRPEEQNNLRSWLGGPLGADGSGYALRPTVCAHSRTPLAAARDNPQRNMLAETLLRQRETGSADRSPVTQGHGRR